MSSKMNIDKALGYLTQQKWLISCLASFWRHISRQKACTFTCRGRSSCVLRQNPPIRCLDHVVDGLIKVMIRLTRKKNTSNKTSNAEAVLLITGIRCGRFFDARNNRCHVLHLFFTSFLASKNLTQSRNAIFYVTLAINPVNITFFDLK